MYKKCLQSGVYSPTIVKYKLGDYVLILEKTIEDHGLISAFNNGMDLSSTPVSLNPIELKFWSDK